MDRIAALEAVTELLRQHPELPTPQINLGIPVITWCVVAEGGDEAADLADEMRVIMVAIPGLTEFKWSKPHTHHFLSGATGDLKVHLIAPVDLDGEPVRVPQILQVSA